MNTTPEWLPVYGYPLYEINIHGQVRRAADGNNPPGVIKKYSYDRGGYPRVLLSIRGKKRFIKIHRALLETFVGPPPTPGMFVLHWDDDPSNFALDNLRWGTRLDNVADARRNGRIARIGAHFRDRTHCANGHEYTEENTAIRWAQTGTPARRCRTCNREYARRARELHSQ